MTYRLSMAEARRPTPRQRQALAGLLAGLSVDEIAPILKVTRRTVYRDLEAARVDLGAAAMAQLLLSARDAGWISGSERLTPSGVVATSIRALARGERQRRP